MLAGYRVVELADESGFLAGKILGDMGADVVKVEPPGGDRRGRRGPYLGGRPDPERSLSWLALNTSKRGVTLDLRAPAGRELFRRLAARADALLETAAPGELEALGLGWDDLREAQPRLVWCSITPFGRTGPYARYRGHDLVSVAMGGNASATGDADRPPLRCSLPTAYYHAAPEAALGITMALYAREDSGRGQLVDVSLQECQLQSLLSGPGQCALTGRLPARGGGRMGRTREIWPTRNGWVSFGLRGGRSRIPNLVAMVRYMDECGMAPDWLREYDWEGFNHNELGEQEIARLEEAFGAFFRSKTMRELYDEAVRRRIMLAPCNDAREILEHPQLRARELFAKVEYPELGAVIEQPDFFAKVDAGRVGLRRRAPRVGEHNAEVYGELGLAAAEIEKLAAEGVI